MNNSLAIGLLFLMLFGLVVYAIPDLVVWFGYGVDFGELLVYYCLPVFAGSALMWVLCFFLFNSK